MILLVENSLLALCVLVTGLMMIAGFAGIRWCCFDGFRRSRWRTLGVAYGWIGSSLWLSVCALLCGLCAFCRVDAMLRFRFLYCSCVLLYFLCVFLVVLQVVFIMWFGTRVCCWWAKKQWLGGGERGNALLTACLDLLQMRREFVWVGWGWNTPWQPVWICSRGKNGCLLLFAMNLDHFGRFWDFGQFRDLKKKEK